MQGKNHVQVSVAPHSMQSGDLSPKIFTRQGHHQYPARNNRVVVKQQPQSWSPTSSVEELAEKAPDRRTKRAKKIDPPENTTCFKALLIIVGVVIAAIALTGMGLGIYAVINVQQAKASNATTTTTTTTATTTTAVLPAQCSSYAVINDATRLTTYSTGTTGSDTGYAVYPTWVRFLGQGGTQLATSAPSMYRCGTTYSGWYTDALPAPGSTVVGTVCYVSTTNYCVLSNLIPVTNCGSFYVYGLVDPPTTYARYCTM